MHFRHLFVAAGTAAVLSMASPVNAAVIDFTTLVLNTTLPGVSATPGVLTLSDGPNLADPGDPDSNIGGSSSAFMATPFSTADGFTTSFTLLMSNTGFDPLADGMTFIIQNEASGVNALGGGGANIGAGGLLTNVGIGFQSWDNNHATIFNNGDVSGGSLPLGNFLLGSQDDIVSVTVGYAGGILSFTALNTVTLQSVSDSQSYDLASLGPTAFIGFTAATGLSHARQQVTDWDFTVLRGAGAAVPEPTAWALMISGFGLAGATLRRRRALAV